jgi:hypothetical protein
MAHPGYACYEPIQKMIAPPPSSEDGPTKKMVI